MSSHILNLNIKVGSDEVTISVEDAKKLYEELRLLFGDKYTAPFWDKLPKYVPPPTFGEPSVWYTTTSSKGHKNEQN